MTTKKLVQDLDAQLSHEENLAQDALPNVRKVYVKSLETGDAADLNLKFSLSLLLIKSAKRRDNEEGLELLSELVAAGYHTTDCYYSVALGLYRMGRFEESRTQCEMLLRMDPDHTAAERLHVCLLHKIAQRDRVVGISAVLGLGLAGAAGVAAAVLLGSRR